MAETPRERLEREKTNIKEMAEDGTITANTCDHLLEYTDALDPDKARYSYEYDNGTGDYSPRTVAGYLSCLRILARDHLDLLDATPAEFNDAINIMHDEEDKSKVTLQRYQWAAIHFYRYHDHLGFDTDEVRLFKDHSEPRHDERDMFTEEEVEALRAACGETKNPPRNRAMLELLIFTGQRLSALLTLRIKDVELNPPGNDNTSYIYLNEDYEQENGGLKGATERGRKRPMFGTRKYVRDWIQYHPQGDDPEAWLFIGDPNHWKTNLDDHLARPTARQRLKQIGEIAGVGKLTNPHAFRHYCATVLYRDYELDRDTIRMLFGHVKGSTALEQVYSHLFEDDYIKKAEEKMGYREPEPCSPFTPETCPTCGELLEEGWKNCPACGENFAPTADIAESVEETKAEATTAALGGDLSEGEREGLKTLLSMIDDPAELAEKLESLE